MSRSNSSAERGGFLKSIWTLLSGWSIRTASGEGAVPPPASGAVGESCSGPGGEEAVAGELVGSSPVISW